MAISAENQERLFQAFMEEYKKGEWIPTPGNESESGETTAGLMAPEHKYPEMNDQVGWKKEYKKIYGRFNLPGCTPCQTNSSWSQIWSEIEDGDYDWGKVMDNHKAPVSKSVLQSNTNKPMAKKGRAAAPKAKANATPKSSRANKPSAVKENKSVAANTSSPYSRSFMDMVINGVNK